ncbi:MAG: ParA family protein [Clostridia bacterium]
MLKFKKNTIFSREKSENSTENIASSGVLAVWGTPSSGKTIISARIADYLASKKQNVVLLLCDDTAPMLPCIIPPTELEIEKSLGSILAVPTVTENIVRHNMITLKHNSHLTLVGMLKGENEYTYAPYTTIQAEQLIDVLREIADFVVIDCSSYIANDVLSAVALKEADDVLRLVNCDLKSISYLSSQLLLIRNNNFDMDRQYRIASNVKPNQSIDKMSGALGNVTFTLPHSSEIEEMILQGNLFAELSLKNSREFRKEIAKICKEVFGI